MDKKDFSEVDKLLFKAILAENAKLKEIIETVKLLTSELNLEALLKIIMSEVTKVMEADRSTLYLIDKEKNELWTKIAQGPDMIPFRISLDQGIAGYVARTGERINITDAHSDPRHFRSIDQKTGYVTKSMLCLPLNNMSGQRIGVLQALNKLSGDKIFTSEDEQLLAGLASQIAIAVENAQLHESLKKANQEIQETYISTLDALITALDARDIETTDHSRRVVEYSMILANVMGIEGHQLENLRLGAMLHDVGKIGVPDAILRKPGPLDSEERKEMEKHPAVGYGMLVKIDFLKEALAVVLHHHERYDGQGYPVGLSRDEIPTLARIFAVADTFDAITSNRPYRKGRSYEEAKEEILKYSETQFDPKVIEAFLKVPKERWYFTLHKFERHQL